MGVQSACESENLIFHLNMLVVVLSLCLAVCSAAPFHYVTRVVHHPTLYNAPLLFHPFSSYPFITYDINSVPQVHAMPLAAAADEAIPAEAPAVEEAAAVEAV